MQKSAEFVCHQRGGDKGDGRGEFATVCLHNRGSTPMAVNLEVFKRQMHVATDTCRE